MSLHDEALKHVAHLVHGKVNHKLGSAQKFNGREPDVIVWQDAWHLKGPDLHEVEAINLDQDKLEAYKYVPGKKFLWLVLPSGTRNTYKEVIVLLGPNSNPRQVLGKEFD